MVRNDPRRDPPFDPLPRAQDDADDVDDADDAWRDAWDGDGGRAAPAWASRAASWLQATPAELAGLAILLMGALLASVLLWSGASGRPAALPDGDAQDAGGAAATVGQPAGDLEHGPDHDVATSGDGAGGSGPTVDPGEAGWAAAGSVTDAGGAPAPAGPVTVHVSGAVQRPGLVELPAGGRVGHAIEAVGGLTADADLAAVNLARPLADGEQVHVRRQGEEPRLPPADAAAAPDGGSAGAALGGGIDAEGRVDLNRATAAELESLPGIGPAKAAAIVEHREAHGPFAEPGDIRAVSGIGEKTFQQLADRITAG
jgi:competence protein ComEA